MKTLKTLLIIAILLAFSPAFALLPVGADAPDFTLTDINGMSHTLSDYKGQVVLMEFFSSQCTTCHEISGFLESLYQDYRDQGFIVFAVDFDVIIDDLSTVQDYAALYEWTFPAFWDYDSVIPGLYDYNGYLPTCITIGKDMKIYKAVEKFHPEATYRGWIDGALSQDPEKLEIKITTDNIIYVMGIDPVNAYLELNNPGADVLVDVAIGILNTQKNKLWFLPDWSLNYYPYPLKLPADWSFPKTQFLSLNSIQHPFNELGEYILAAAMFEQGTLNLLSLSSTTFSIVVTSNQ